MNSITKVPREARWSIFYLLAALAVLAALVVAPQAHATSGYQSTWSGLYPGSASDNNAGCQLCHGSSTQNINPYGFAMAQCNGASGSITQRIQAIEGVNSDGDPGNFSNLQETNANAQPGWTTAGPSEVWSRNGCVSQGTNTYPGSGDLDPAAPNVPPTADANGPYNGTVGTPVSFDGTGSNDPDGTIVSYEWDFGDGGTGTGATPTYTYAAAGNYTVSLTVTDDGGATDTATSTANIGAGNAPPIADANGPYNGTAGIAVTFDGSASTDPDGTIVAYDWDFGDGNTGTGVSPTNTYALAGTYTVTLTVTDDGGLTDAATSTATIVAAPQDPIADPNGPYNGFEGQPVAFDGNGSFDPDGGNITAYDWDFGDGNTGTGVAPSHAYATAGTYTVTLTVVDDEGATSAPVTTTATIEAPQANIPPTSDPNGPYTGTMGQPVSFDGSGSSDPDGSIVSYEWDFGDGNTGTGVSPTHTYAAAGTYTVSLTVTDDGTPAESDTVTTTATISEAAACSGIDNLVATWSDQGNGRLRVEGTGVRDGVFILSNALDPNQIIGTRNGNNGKVNFNVNGRNLNPVPCIVQVDQPDVQLCGQTEVLNAPADCAPKPPEMPVARGDTYATAVGKTLTVQLSRVSGVLYNDFDTDIDGSNIGNGGLTAVLVSGPTAGTLDVIPGQSFDGSFEYVPGPSLTDNTNDSFTYQAEDADGNLSDVATVNIHVLSDQPDFKIMMNYELGMHCTGFEFSYCCVLPPYNSILAQVVKPQQPGNPQSNADFARLLEGDPNNGLDGLGRETVLRDYDGNGNFQKYYLEYFHDAQPRREGNMPGSFNDQTSTLISDIEGNSMLYHNTPYDSALVDTDGLITGVPGKLVRDTYNGLSNVVVGDGDYTGAADNYANGWLNHFYIYPNADGKPNLEGENATAGVSLEADKIRLGVNGMVVYPKNVGAALQPMGPDGNVSGFDNVLTFSADTGTVVYTQMKVLENLPIMLTSPRIWEALGLPLTPFEDSIDFFTEGENSGPGFVDEDSIRPYVAMKARLHYANCDAAGNCTKGGAVLASNEQPVIGHGTAPIDIPNCERCHSVPAYQPDGITPNVNSPSYVREGDGPVFGPTGLTLEAITDLEINYWKSIYPSLTTGPTDWYARLKGAAVNMLAMHDLDQGTGFLDNYPATGDVLDLPLEKQIPQNTRMGHESVICQKCHGDNVIAAVAPMGQNPNAFRPRPISEAIHHTHRSESEGGVIAFNDGLGRDGGCQGCHPAHRSDGVMDNYPITIAGDNANADGDNRLNQGGCFVGRDVHSNPLKDVDGAETDEHLNALGQYLKDYVSNNQAGLGGSDVDNRGIWCTNCHSQAGQEMWKAEDCEDLINGDCITNPRAAANMDDLATALKVSLAQLESWVDPKDPGVDPDLPLSGPDSRTGDTTHAIWNPDPGLCDYVSGYLGITPVNPDQDGNVATVEVNTGSAAACSTGGGSDVVSCGGEVPDFYICGTLDGDGDFSVNILDFCTTPDCVTAAGSTPGFPANSLAVPVPFSAATDGRDHWLSAGEPHCADCHAAPYVEQSGNINPFPPFNYPRKASLMRYSRGHQDLGCQACHESIHGLYPVSAAIDTTSYAQAAALNHDGSHGPLKCGACHQVGGNGLPTWLDTAAGNVYGITDFDSGVTWAHTYTDEADVRESTCQNCHGDFAGGIGASSGQCRGNSSIDECYLGHADSGRTSRLMMDKAEIAQLGHILGAATLADGVTPNPDVNAERTALCSACHGQELGDVGCDGEWREHLTQGRVAESVWEEISLDETDTRCGW